MGIISWFKNNRTPRRKHDAAWNPVEIFEEDGLTVFQKICNEKLIDAFSEFPEFKEFKQISAVCEKYIVGTLPNSKFKYWIYANCARVEGHATQEKYSYDTPELLITEFVRRAIDKALTKDES
jgi:hypothetical protein